MGKLKIGAEQFYTDTKKLQKQLDKKADFEKKKTAKDTLPTKNSRPATNHGKKVELPSGKSTLPTKKGSQGNKTKKDVSSERGVETNSIKSRHLNQSMVNSQLDEVNKHPTLKALANYSEGLLDAGTFGLSKVGRDKDNEHRQQLRKGKTAKVSHLAGEMTGYALPYKGAEGLLTKGATKALSTKAGQKVVSSAIGKKVGKTAIESATKAALGDATIGVAQNLGMEVAEGKRGKELVKSVAKDSAMDFALGGAIEAAPILKKGIKKFTGNVDDLVKATSVGKKVEARKLEKATGNANLKNELKTADLRANTPTLNTASNMAETPIKSEIRVDNQPDKGYNLGKEGANYGEKIQQARTGTISNGTVGEGNLRQIDEGISRVGVAGRTRINSPNGTEELGRTGRYTGDVRIDSNTRKRMTDRGIVDTHLQSSDHAFFSAKLDEGKASNKYGSYVDPQSVEELQKNGTRTFLSDDGSVGVAVERDGNIVGAFNSGGKYRGAVNDMLITARANGGAKMDCYGMKLVNKYEQAGFIPVARVDFDPAHVNDELLLKNKPDIYVMMKNTDDLDTVIDKAASHEYKISTQTELDNLPTFGYDEALAYRDKLLRQSESRASLPTKNNLKPNGADVNKFPSEPKVSKAKANGALDDGKKYVYETESHAQRREAAKERLDTDYEGEYKELTTKEYYNSEDFATSARLASEEYKKGNTQRVDELMYNAAKNSSEKGQELEAVKHIKEDTPEGMLYQGQLSAVRAEKKFKAKNPKAYERAISESKVVHSTVREAMQKSVYKTTDELIKKYKLSTVRETSDKIVKSVVGGNKHGVAPLQKSFGDMKSEIMRLIDVEKQPKAKISQVEKWIDFMGSKTENTKEWENVLYRTRLEVTTKLEEMFEYDDDLLDEILKKVDGLFDSYAYKYNLTQLDKAMRETVDNLGETLTSITKKNKEDKDAILQSLQDELTKGIRDESTVNEIRKLVKENYEKNLKETAKEDLLRQFSEKPRTKAEKGVFDKVIELINQGAYDDYEVTQLMKQKNNIPVLTKEQSNQILEFMEKSKDTNIPEYQQRVWKARAEQIVANTEPATAHDKFRSLQRVGMLSNPKTLISRNAGGNIIFEAADSIKDIPASMIDYIVSLKTGQRTTQGITLGKVKASAEGFAKGFSEQVKDIKYGVDTSTSRTAYELPNKKVWDASLAKTPVGKIANHTLDFLDTFVGKALQFGDRPFYEAQYAARKAELESLIKKGKHAKMSEKEMDEACKLFALDKVFQNDSYISKTASQIRGSLGYFGDIVVPFTQTPSNILSKLINYSPAGFGEAIYELGKAGKGTFNQKKFVDTLGRALTGTGVMALGAALAKKGMIVTEVYDKSNFDEYKNKTGMGVQANSLKIGDTYYSIDWANPVGQMLLMGAEIGEVKSNAQSIADAIYGSTVTGIDGFFSQSFVQGIASLFSSGDSITESVVQQALKAPQQLIPNALKGVTNVIDPYKRETYDANPLKKTWNEMKASLPVISETLPTKKDILGEDVKRYQGRDTGSKILESFINPANVSQTIATYAQKEVMRLYEATGSQSVLFNTAEKKLKYDGETYEITNGAELSQIQEDMGKYANREVSKLIKTSEYRRMSDDEKQERISSIQNAAKKYATEEYLIRTGKTTRRELALAKLPNGMASITKGKDAEKLQPLYATAREEAKTLDPSTSPNGITQGEAQTWINRQKNLTEHEKHVLFKGLCPSAKNNPYKY